MSVPMFCPVLGISVYLFKEKFLKKPQVRGVQGIKTMQVFKAGKEHPPPANKAFSNVNPHTFNSLVPCRSACVMLVGNYCSQAVEGLTIQT